MQIVHKIKMFMMLVSLQAALLSAAECKESELFPDEKDVQLYVSLSPHLDEGFEVLKAHDQSLSTYYDFLKTRVKRDDQIIFDHENDILADEKYPNLGNVIEEAESVIVNKMKDSFLTIFEDTIKKPSQDIYEINDPIFRYVMNHRDGFMQPILRDWIKSQNSNDGTLLSTAAEYDNLQAVEIGTLLSTAAEYDNLQAVEILLAAGCNHLTRSHRYHELAYRRHYLYLCQLRVDKKILNWRSYVFIGDDESIQRRGKVINEYFYNYKNIHLPGEYNMNSSFQRLAMRKTFGMIKIAYKIERSSSVDGCLGDGYSDALLNYSEDHYLVKRNFMHSYQFGVTPLHQAVANNSLKMMQMLIDDHIDVDSKDILDDTPLHVATENNLVQAMRLLIDAGAYVNARNILGLTPLHCAIKNNSIDSFRLLISTPGVDLQQKVVPINQCIAHIIFDRTYSIFKDAGKTPLFLAIESRNIENVQELLEASVNPNIKNDKNDESYRHTNAPLHYAVQYNLLEFIDLLIDAGADINMQDCLGNTPLHYAYYYDEGWLKLMAYYPNIQIQNNEGETAEQLRMEWLSRHIGWQEREPQRRNQARQQASCCAIS